MKYKIGNEFTTGCYNLKLVRMNLEQSIFEFEIYDTELEKQIMNQTHDINFIEDLKRVTKLDKVLR